MKIAKKILLSPLALLYIIGVALRHKLFDWGVLSSTKPSTPTICVGNITVGGSGKSPMVELLASSFSQDRSIAILSRGYGRRTKGYREVQSHDSYLDVGDEPLQIKRKLPDTIVVVCEKRAEGIARIEREHPEVKLIIMDDGFQHRYVTPHCNIIMVDATRPTFEDLPLPAGELRDTQSALRRADIFVVTKCPATIDEERFRRGLLHTPRQSIYFTQIVNSDPRPTYPNEATELTPEDEVIALSGIGNPAPFIETIKSRHNVVEILTYPDHHSYSTDDLVRISKLCEGHPNSKIITTEKDSVKFLSNNQVPQIIKERLYYSPIQMKFISGSQVELLKTVESYV